MTKWVSVNQAKAYIAACRKSKTTGLKYCSAIDFLEKRSRSTFPAHHRKNHAPSNITVSTCMDDRENITEILNKLDPYSCVTIHFIDGHDDTDYVVNWLSDRFDELDDLQGNLIR